MVEGVALSATPSICSRAFREVLVVPLVLSEKGEKVVHLQLLAFRLFSKFILVSRQPEIGYNSLRED